MNNNNDKVPLIDFTKEDDSPKAPAEQLHMFSQSFKSDKNKEIVLNLGKISPGKNALSNS